MGTRDYLKEPTITLLVGPQQQPVTFLVDTGAEKTCVTIPIKGHYINKNYTTDVCGAKGETFTAPVIKNCTIAGNHLEHRGDIIYLPQAGVNLLGRDFQVPLRIGVVPQGPQMRVKLFTLSIADEQEINPVVWAKPGNRGCINMTPIKISLLPGTPAIRVPQYPLTRTRLAGLRPVIQELLQDGILEKCKSPHNTPILAVRKPDGTYRLVQDLRKVNDRVQARFPLVQNPYTLLSQVPHNHGWFSVVDLKDAFWSCPLDPSCRDIFAFTWEDPDTRRRQQLRWTRLPQGYSEAPTLFGQALEELLSTFEPPKGTKIIQYVDDLLLSGEQESTVRLATIKLLNFLGENGLRVSKQKLQFVKPEVMYLGHQLERGIRKLTNERINAILNLTPPKNKREIRQFLGLIGYCRLWVDKYTQSAKFLYEKLTENEPINWNSQDTQKLEELKQKLASAPVLSLPDLGKPFDLFVNVEEGVAYGVLAQEWAGSRKPVAFLSKLLDPVSRGWPVCIQSIAATALLVAESQKIVFGGTLNVFTPHTVKTILSERAATWITDPRMVKYETILLHTQHLNLTTCNIQNPAQFLYGVPGEADPVHNCLSVISLQTKIREDLTDTPLDEGNKFFVDGSSRVIDGKRCSGYAIVDGINMKVIEKGKLPPSWSAQICELYALKRALERLCDNIGTIYTDSKYAFGVVHTFGKIWAERGLLNSKGKDLLHRDLILRVLQALQGPRGIAVVHVPGHQRGLSMEAKGNNLADLAAKEAATRDSDIVLELKLTTKDSKKEQHNEPGRNNTLSKPIFTDKEKSRLATIGATEDPEGRWHLPDGRQILNKQLTREILSSIHQSNHWGTKALVDHFTRTFGCLGMYEIANQVTRDCLVCQKVNRKQMKNVVTGGIKLAIRPFQSVQIDFTEMPPCQRWKYLLVIVDHLTHWVEAFPTVNATAHTVSKVILEQIIPRFGMIHTIDSDRGTHFTSQVLQQLAEQVGINWKLHTPWHPQSSGRVERMNQTIKNTLTKLMLETKWTWVKCLPLALLRIRTQPRADICCSPYEMLYGLPYLASPYEIEAKEHGDTNVQRYIQQISQNLKELKEKGLLAQTPPLDFSLHHIVPGDWVLVKSWKEKSLTPSWEGPFQVQLTTESAVRTAEKGWTHVRRVKGPVKAPTGDQDTEDLPTMKMSS